MKRGKKQGEKIINESANDVVVVILSGLLFDGL